VQVGNRTRLVLNLDRPVSFDSRVEGKALFVTLAAAAVAAAPGAPSQTHFAEAKAGDGQHVIRSVNFRRGRDGEGRIVVDLSDSNTGIDVRQQGPNLVVDFINTDAPEAVQRKLDVTDFATPVTTITTLRQGSNTRMVIAPSGLWEHNAYQSESQFVVEVRRLIEDPNKLVQGARGQYQGEKLSLNFQNIDVRAVLQVIADFTNFNIITSDTVSGNLTLRLKDVPWDQALDIILQAKGLDKRKNGNVIWIAPRDEIATREKLELESRAQITDLEPLRTESIQLNYHRAKEVVDFIRTKDQTVLSKRGSAVADDRSNKMFVTDVPSRLDDLRRLVQEIDVPKRQVLIEARIVQAADTFSRDIGVRFGYHNMSNVVPGTSPQYRTGGSLNDTGYHTGQISTTPAFNDSLFFNRPASPTAGGVPGAFSFVLFNAAATKFLNLEITALETDGRGKVISSPRVLTADQVEALIEQGTEIPYQNATSSGATAVQFKKATLSLKVKPQITPDGRILMAVDVNKDEPSTKVNPAAAGGVAIDTRHVKTEVLVENGGTVVIGGIFEQTTRKTVDRVPLLGDLPVLGFFFRSTGETDDRTELLVFLTPRIVSDALSLR
jgi:type IV pilus assembly protein PilQ